MSDRNIPSNEQLERQRFEEWAKDNGLDIGIHSLESPSDEMEYLSVATRFAWRGWEQRAAVQAQPAASKTVVQELRERGDRAYCDYIAKHKKPECLGWEQKIKSGQFGEAELRAHEQAAEQLGWHRAFYVAAELIDKATPVETSGDVFERFPVGTIFQKHPRGNIVALTPDGGNTVVQRPLNASERLHNICDALSEQADESPFTREEWERIDKQTVALQTALRGLYWDNVDYLTRNNLGGMNNHWMKAAREALGISSEGVPPEEPDAVRAGVSVKDPTPPQEIVLCAAMGPSGFICERPKGHPGHHRDGDNQGWSSEKASAPHAPLGTGQTGVCPHGVWLERKCDQCSPLNGPELTK